MVGANLVLCASLLAAFLPAASAGDVDCTETCYAQLTGNSLGSVPSGITFLVTPSNVTNGIGVPECAATCETCSGKITVAFNGLGAYCMTYDQGGGWSSPVSVYARTGLLRSRCGDPTPSFACFRIGACAALPGAYVFEECWLLDCQCII